MHFPGFTSVFLVGAILCGVIGWGFISGIIWLFENVTVAFG